MATSFSCTGAVNERQTHGFFAVSVEAGVAPSLCKQADQGLARGS